MRIEDSIFLLQPRAVNSARENHYGPGARVEVNKTGTSKVGAMSTAQKSALFKNFKGGTPSDFLKIQSVAKYQKVEAGPFGDI